MNPVLNIMLGNYIRDQRMKLGIRQKDLASSLALSSQFLGRIENGRIRISNSNLAQTVEILKLDKMQLVKLLRYSITWYVDSLYSQRDILKLENSPKKMKNSS